MSELKFCNVCVMNTTASNIIFDSNGQCNYCKNFTKKIESTKKIK